MLSAGLRAAIRRDPACELGPNYTPVDHDQRKTLNTGFTANLPAHTWFATNVYYGSGFANGLAQDRAQGTIHGPTCRCIRPSMCRRAMRWENDGRFRLQC